MRYPVNQNRSMTWNSKSHMDLDFALPPRAASMEKSNISQVLVLPRELKGLDPAVLTRANLPWPTKGRLKITASHLAEPGLAGRVLRSRCCAPATIPTPVSELYLQSPLMKSLLILDTQSNPLSCCPECRIHLPLSPEAGKNSHDQFPRLFFSHLKAASP